MSLPFKQGKGLCTDLGKFAHERDVSLEKGNSMNVCVAQHIGKNTTSVNILTFINHLISTCSNLFQRLGYLQ